MSYLRLIYYQIIWSNQGVFEIFSTIVNHLVKYLRDKKGKEHTKRYVTHLTVQLTILLYSFFSISLMYLSISVARESL